MKAYKYTQKDFVKGMVKAGQIKVGTIYDYRRNYVNDEITDIGEGKIQETRQINNLHITDPKSLPDYLKGVIGFGNNVGDKVNLYINNLNVTHDINYQDAYVYCVTLKPSKAVMEQFGYNACVEISDIEAFSQIMAAKMSSKGLTEPGYFGDICKYVGRGINSDVYSHGRNEKGDFYVNESFYWLKPERYRHQEEYRTCMFSVQQTEDLVPTIIITKPLAALCKEIVLR